MERIYRFLSWFVPVYFSAIFSLTTVGGLRIILSHVSTFGELTVDEQLAVLNSVQRTWGGGAFIAGGVMLLILFVAQFKVKSTIERLRVAVGQLKTSNQNLASRNDILNDQVGLIRDNIDSLVENYLVGMSKILSFSDNERISLYLVQPSNTEVVIVKRCSSNPTYKSWRHDIYDMRKGILRDAWNNGSAYIDRLPDAEKCGKKYMRKLGKLGYSEEDVDALTMKARTLYAYRYSSFDKQTHKAIVVVESLNDQFLSKDKLDCEFTRCNDFIFRMVSVFNESIPRGPIAKEREL